MVALHLDGALRRSRRTRSDMVEAVFVGTNGTGKDVQAYQSDLMADDAAPRILPPEALDGVLRYHSREMAVMTPDDILKMRKH